MTQPSGDPTPDPTPAPTPTPTPVPDPTPEDDDPSKWDQERAKATILRQRDSEKALKAEVAAMRVKVEAQEAKERERAQAEMTELERTKAQLEEATAKAARDAAALTESLLKSEVFKEATALNIVDVDLAFLALDQASLVVDGKPTGVKTALEALVKEKPFLVKTPASGGVPPLPTASTGGPSKEQLEKAQKDAQRLTHRAF